MTSIIIYSGSILCSFLVGYSISKRRRSKTTVLQAKLLRDFVYTIDRYEILFPSDLVKYILRDASSIDYSKFYETILFSLKTREHELPDNTRAVILRTVTYNPENNFINYTFEPILDS